MGGGASFLAAENNSIISTLVTFAAAGLVNFDYLNHSVPILTISGQDDTTAPVNEHANVHYDYTPNTTPKAIYEIENGSHSTGRFPSTANNYVGKIVLSWLSYFVSDNDCYFPLILEYPEQASVYQNNLETFSFAEDQYSVIKFYPNPVVDFITFRSEYTNNEKYIMLNNNSTIFIKAIKNNTEINNMIKSHIIIYIKSEKHFF